jgi:hypothetical protein
MVFVFCQLDSQSSGMFFFLYMSHHIDTPCALALYFLCHLTIIKLERLNTPQALATLIVHIASDLVPTYKPGLAPFKMKKSLI